MSPPNERIRRAGQVSWAVVGVVVLVGLLGLVAWTVRVVFPPLVLAAAIVFVLNPVVTALQHRGVPRAVGAGLTYLGVAAVVALAAVLFVPVAADQARDLEEDWPAIQDRAERWVDARAEESQGTFWEFTRADLEGAFSSGDESFADRLDDARDVGLRVFHALLVAVLGPIIALYLLVDLPRVREVAESLVPEHAKPEVTVVAHRLNAAMGGFFRGQLLVALIVGVLCSVGLAAIGLRSWFFVGMIAGLFNVIPLVGPWIGGIPGVVIALTTGSTLQAVGVVVVMVAAQQIDNHLITPQVMQRTVHLHPAAVVLALLAGGTMGGFLGLLVAVPLTAALKIVLGHLWRVHVLGEALPEVAVAQGADDAEPAVGLVEDVWRAPPDGRDGDGRDTDAPVVDVRAPGGDRARPGAHALSSRSSRPV